MKRKLKLTESKKNGGITLITLVVTIVVLLILAGITINMSFGDNGIIKKADELKLQVDYQIIKNNLETYKLKEELVNPSGVEVTNENLIGNIYKKIVVTDTKRELAVIVNFDEIGVNPTYGQGGKNVVENDMNSSKEIDTIYDLRDIYAIDLEDGNLYYINGDQIYAQDVEKIEIAEGENSVKKYSVEVLSDAYVQARKFITEWTITEANQTIELPLDFTYKVLVEWGDGQESIVENTNPDSRKHTYAKAGVYNVKISDMIEGGICTKFYFAADWAKADLNHSLITNVIQWGELNLQNISFHSCINLKGPIPSPSDNSFINITNFNNLFVECINLTGEIPADLFKNASKATEYTFTFSNCKKLTGEIPKDLFKDANENINSFSHVFNGCENLTGKIPKELFANKKVKIFTAAFQGCKNITEIEAGLFDDVGESVTYMNGTFSTTGITKIPQDLFKYNTKVKTFQEVFNNCTGLTGEIPQNLFATNIEAVNFRYTFYNCKKLTGKIRKDIFSSETVEKEIDFNSTFMWCTNLEGIEFDVFDSYPNIINFTRTFNQCNKLSGEVPKIWERTNVQNYSGCFSAAGYSMPGETSLITNWDEIPEGWKT